MNTIMTMGRISSEYNIRRKKEWEGMKSNYEGMNESNEIEEHNNERRMYIV